MAEKFLPESDFVRQVKAGLRRANAMTGRPREKDELARALEAAGMTSEQFRLVMAWWDSGTAEAGFLVDVLHDEARWRDVVEVAMEQQAEAQEAAPISHYPGFAPEGGYETNPLIREMRRHPPYTDQDAVEAFQRGFGRDLWTLAFRLGWSTDQERADALRDGIEPEGVERLRGVLAAAGIETGDWCGTKPRGAKRALRRVK